MIGRVDIEGSKSHVAMNAWRPQANYPGVVEAGQRAMSFGRTNRRDKRSLLLAALDVRNAFNTASWQAIATALQAKGVPAGLQRIIHNYFQH